MRSDCEERSRYVLAVGRGRGILLTACGSLIVALAIPLAAHGDDLKAAAAQMSQRSFALLSSLNAESSGGSSSPLLSPVATFASDSENLSHALAQNDVAAAAKVAATLDADRGAINSALASHPRALPADDWKGIEQQLNTITKQITLAGGTSAGPAPAAVAETSTATGVPPRVSIDSRTAQGDVVRIKGFMQGSALKSAGIYESGRRLRAFKVNDVPGQQKVDFDIGLSNPGPNTTIRVTDAEGRFAEAAVVDATSAAAHISSSTPEVATPETPTEEPLSADSGSPDASIASTPPAESGVEGFRGSHSSNDSDNGAGIKEIPSHGAVTPSPSKRRTLGGHLGNVQINVLGVSQTATSPPTYDVVGQITGQGITRAGIYVDGRLVKKIPVEHGGGFMSFDQRFIMNGGEATIRAYGIGNQFVESSVDASSGVAALAPAVPMMPEGLAIQITAVRPVSVNLYVVSGLVSGRNLASAGLYQNGMLVQNLNLGGGIGGILGALIPGNHRNVNFSARFNPNGGQTSIRAFDTSGAYTEQPVMAGGISPYGYGSNPYGYGSNPYAGVNPFGMPANPYYGGPPSSPYLSNPYTRPRTPPTRPLW
jgi:hypothetical protein